MHYLSVMWSQNIQKINPLEGDEQDLDLYE